MAEANGKRRKDRDLNDFSFPEFRPPEHTISQLKEISRAAKLHAERNISDPFACGRIFLHMKRGIANVGEVIADARGPAANV